MCWQPDKKSISPTRIRFFLHLLRATFSRLISIQEANPLILRASLGALGEAIDYDVPLPGLDSYPG